MLKLFHLTWGHFHCFGSVRGTEKTRLEGKREKAPSWLRQRQTYTDSKFSHELNYYTFKIFCCFWLTQSPQVIVHNQPPSTNLEDAGNIPSIWWYIVIGNEAAQAIDHRSTWFSGAADELFIPEWTKTNGVHGYSKIMWVNFSLELRGINAPIRKIYRSMDVFYFLRSICKDKYLFQSSSIHVEKYGRPLLYEEASLLITQKYFKWIIKQLLNSAFFWWEELLRSRRMLSTSAVLDLHISSHPTQPHSIIAKYNTNEIQLQRPL